MGKLRLKKQQLNECILMSIDPSLNGSCIMLFNANEVFSAWLFTNIGKNGLIETVEIQSDSDTKNRLVVNLIHSKLKDHYRILKIREVFEKIVKQYKPHFAAIEHYSYGSVTKSNSIYAIGELGWMFRSIMLDNKIPYREYNPLIIKEFATGSAKAPKSRIVTTVTKNWEKYDFSIFDKPGEDLADAYVIGQLLYTDISVMRNINELNKFPQYVKKIFTHKSKSNPIPLIKRQFIKI